MRDLDAFRGEWRLERRIRDDLGPAGRLSGRLSVQREGDTYRLTERGTLLLGSASFETSRETLWRAEGDAIAVSFADGRPFHRIAGGARPADTHLCGDDIYEMWYDFTRWPVWRVAWRVRGPRKSWCALSLYRRL